MTPADVVNKLLATRYQRLGRGPHIFDCWGLIIEALRLQNLPVPVDPVAASTSPSECRKIFEAHIKPEDWRHCGPEDGAISFMPGFASAFHAGLMIEGRLLQTTRANGPTWRPLSAFPHIRMEFAQWDP